MVRQQEAVPGYERPRQRRRKCDRHALLCWRGARPVPAQMWHGASPVPARMWHGDEPSHGADVAEGAGCLKFDCLLHEPQVVVQRPCKVCERKVFMLVERSLERAQLATPVTPTKRLRFFGRHERARRGSRCNRSEKLSSGARGGRIGVLRRGVLARDDWCVQRITLNLGRVFVLFDSRLEAPQRSS